MGIWAVPAGHVEHGESVAEAAVREVREEVGVEIDPADLVPVTAMHRTGGNGDPIDERVDFFFTATRWTGEPRLMEPEKADRAGVVRAGQVAGSRRCRTRRGCWTAWRTGFPPVIVHGFS